MSSIFTIGESHEPVKIPNKSGFVETFGPNPPAPKKKKRKPRFNKLRSNKGFYISTTNSNLLTAAKIVAEKKGVSVVYVVGPSGWGKTRLGYEYARQIDYNVVYVPATSVMEQEEWFGVRHVENDETVFRHTEFANALTKGKTVIIIDELSRVAPFILNPLLSLMHDEGEFTVHNETFRPAKDTIFFITANIGSEYVGTYELDVALESRLTVQLEVGEMPITNEFKITKSQVGCMDEVAEVAVKLIRYAREHNLTMRDVSPRATIKTATLLDTGLPVKFVISQLANTIEDMGDRKSFIDYTKSSEFKESVIEEMLADDDD